MKNSFFLIITLPLFIVSTGYSQRRPKPDQKVQVPQLVITNVTPKCEDGNFLLAVTFASVGCSNQAGETCNFVITSGENIIEVVPSVLACLTTEIVVTDLECENDYSIYVEYDDKVKKTNVFDFHFPFLVPCCGSPNQGCCPGSENIMQFSNFELLSQMALGNIPSDYEKEETVAPGSLNPGEYAFLDGEDAAVICDDWNIVDHTTCDNTGKFVVVNGATGQSGIKKIWSGSVLVEAEKDYRFCAYFKSLSPSCGDERQVTPKIDIKFGVAPSEFDITGQVINNNLSDACEWMEISKVISFDFAQGLNIAIYLDETEVGDGNDLAIDDISLQEATTLPNEYVKFGLSSPTDLGDGFFRVMASAPPIPESIGGCGFAWEIVKLDGNYQEIPGTKIYNPSQWWALSTYSTVINFPGYDGMTNTLLSFNPSSSIPAGKFKYTDRYKITRAVWCDCYSWNKSSLIIEPVGN